ncbi:MAG TPA: hypothetical protein VFE51_10965, partial [Verrucomicrobiae bacterium]|nr:hypothetical protein [Verrucomicrobiae bacterium]
GGTEPERLRDNVILCAAARRGRRSATSLPRVLEDATDPPVVIFMVFTVAAVTLKAALWATSSTR